MDDPALWSYMRELYRHPGVRGTVDVAHIKRHYCMSHTTINPHRIAPAGPVVDFDRPPDRVVG